ncbi:MAG: WYL domain-containing protein, partial [Culicoidibacterales bacterium]
PWMDEKVIDGRLSVYVQSAKKQNIIEDLLSFGPELTVIEPESIITELTQQLRATLENYH